MFRTITNVILAVSFVMISAQALRADWSRLERTETPRTEKEYVGGAAGVEYVLLCQDGRTTFGRCSGNQ